MANIFSGTPRLTSLHRPYQQRKTMSSGGEFLGTFSRHWHKIYTNTQRQSCRLLTSPTCRGSCSVQRACHTCTRMRASTSSGVLSRRFTSPSKRPVTRGPNSLRWRDDDDDDARAVPAPIYRPSGGPPTPGAGLHTRRGRVDGSSRVT